MNWRTFRRFLPQPVVGVVLVLLGVLAPAAAWAMEPLLRPDLSPSALGVTLGLAGAVVAAYRYPIHVRLHTKVLPVTVVYYLLAVLASPLLASLAAGLGALIGELSQRARTGAYPSDIAAEVGRRMVIVLIAALVAHAGGDPASQPWTLLAAAVMLASLDALSVPLVMAPMSGDRPFWVLLATADASWQAEGMQYLVGLLGAIAASRYPWILPLLAVPCALLYAAFKALKEMHENTRHLLEAMADAVDLRDAYTGGHSQRVAEYSGSILRELGLEGPEVTLIQAAARVHDIGKIGVPDAVLHKPGKLTEEERAVMELHPVHGAKLLKRYADFSRGVEMVLHHHESWDGTGYPDRLAGKSIPFGARVIAVADSFDAMTSDRPYRQGMSVATAVEILRAGRDRQWDATLVDAFVRSITAQHAAPDEPSVHLVPAPMMEATESAAPTVA